MSTLIVDCGSGLTRAAVFWGDAGNRVHACEASASTGQAEPFALPRIVDVLTEGGSALRRWVASIQELVVATGCTSTVIGATGGLRQAEAAGRVTPRMLASLGELLRELVPAAEFRSLSGEDEARAELGAVGWHDPPGAAASFLSVTHGLIDAAASLCERADGAADEDARSCAIEAFGARLAAEVSASGRRGQLRGTLVAIEMVGACGSADEYGGRFAGLARQVGQRVVGKAALVAALREHLQQWARGGAVASRHEAYAGLLPAELLGLAGLADEGASFYLCRSFEVAPGVTLKPSWSLGVYLSRSAAPPPPPSPLEHS
ncbi:hypothetical protein EMIHUDRAFT_244477 [Emiliania huxleyi CCMP1516]|uniref:Uncharacterized protein n=2 Tax=Emiliania huxleyi TaxID=2903 RepID=A0A0D3J0M8_EMIH1|nr:hypothetical protein EMIHUDRAFT_244477 [Emiliania huxleyi CCMP1516]EOD17063.1 hypothetical protein EMIHUDRAFT_244477 [Emiliania huxleyi CCMP1516]|eukprot:XP_005769492.1 hypothetical protein EMIHUDRAFT_244477 [Emiliania huxleyi CCMP1516]